MILNETVDWKRHYLPIDLTGKTVLDVGGGEGESARFFLQHGAKKVVSIEPEVIAYKYLKFNASNHSPKIQSINQPFCLEHLTEFNVDFLKMDIEGYEEALLGVKLPYPVALPSGYRDSWYAA